MHIYQTNYQGNPYIGLFGFANDKVCLVGHGFNKHDIEKIGKALKVPVYQISICSTGMVGVFCAGNNNCLLLPSTAYDNEIKEIKKICKEVNMECKVISTELTALGNNILCNDKGALVNPDFSARVKKDIRQALNVTLHPGTIALHGITGSLCVTRKDKAIVTSGILESEQEELSVLLEIETFTNGTVNFGSQNVSSGLIVNSHGFIVGDMSTGVEMTTVDEGLGFLEEKQ